MTEGSLVRSAKALSSSKDISFNSGSLPGEMGMPSSFFAFCEMGCVSDAYLAL